MSWLRKSTAEERRDCRAAMESAFRLSSKLTAAAPGCGPVPEELLALARALNVLAQEPARPVAETRGRTKF